MKEEIMKKLIIDNNMLVYIHDVLAINEKDINFKYSKTYVKLHEFTIITIIRYLKKTTFVAILFMMIVNLLKKINYENNIIMLALYLVISIIFGVLFVSCKNDLSDLIYQLKLNNAVVFAFNNFTYEEYVIFLDKYLSEISTKNYFVTNN